MANKSRVELTEEEAKFYRQLLVRVTNTTLGQPFLSRAFFKFTPISAPGLRTMAVDELWRVYIDFDYLMPKGIIYASGFLAHEIWHPLRQHAQRMNKMPETPPHINRNLISNIAGDLELNDDIRDLIPADLLMPGVGSFAKFQANQTYDYYWKQLIANPDILELFEPKKPEQKQQEQEQEKEDTAEDSEPDKGEDEKGEPEDGEETESSDDSAEDGESESSESSEKEGDSDQNDESGEEGEGAL